MTSRGFTLVELLVVVAIMGILSTMVVVAVGSSRASARDTKRLTDIRNLQKAIELSFDVQGVYPGWAPPPASDVTNDCDGNGSVKNQLNGLVTAGYLATIPSDPAFPNNPWPSCYFYITNSTCGTGDAMHPYVLIFQNERNSLNLPSWNNEALRYCIYSE